MPDQSLSIADGVVKPFQTGQMHKCQKDLVSRALDRQVDIHCPFEDLPKSDQDWVINGDLRPDLTADEVWESGGWYGIRGFFDWMESRAYRMHVRVFLSRYRAYTLCPECHGTRFKPETLEFSGSDRKAALRSAGSPADAGRGVRRPGSQNYLFSKAIRRPRRSVPRSSPASNTWSMSDSDT